MGASVHMLLFGLLVFFSSFLKKKKPLICELLWIQGICLCPNLKRAVEMSTIVDLFITDLYEDHKEMF